MARLRRLILPGVAAHIVQRGNNRNPCFFAPPDYRLYLRYVREQASEKACAVHAYCLMSNHVHLLVTPSTAEGCSEFAKAVGQRYVRYINRAYGRTGTLWEGRYRSCLARTARYVLACYRYIELNPVRAAIVDHPADYVWSSYRSNTDPNATAWLTPHAEYLALSADPDRRARLYEELVQSGLDARTIDEVRRATRRGIDLGSRSARRGIPPIGV